MAFSDTINSCKYGTQMILSCRTPTFLLGLTLVYLPEFQILQVFERMRQKAHLPVTLLFLLSLTLTYFPASEGGILRCYETGVACLKGDPNQPYQKLSCGKW